MKEWFNRVEKSLARGLAAVENGVPAENMYMLAVGFYSEEKHMNNDQLFKEIADRNEEQFKNNCRVDPQSKYQFKFHYVASYLSCYVTAGKIDEMKYDRIMDYVCERLDLFSDDYEYD